MQWAAQASDPHPPPPPLPLGSAIVGATTSAPVRLLQVRALLSVSTRSGACISIRSVVFVQVCGAA